MNPLFFSVGFAALLMPFIYVTHIFLADVFSLVSKKWLTLLCAEWIANTFILSSSENAQGNQKKTMLSETHERALLCEEENEAVKKDGYLNC